MRPVPLTDDEPLPREPQSMAPMPRRWDRLPPGSCVGLRVALVIAAGLGVGVLTSVGQTYLGGALNAFVNSASTWLFGAAGHLWRTGSAPVRGLGSTLLPSAFLAEGLWVYLHELHYIATAALWIVIGLGLGFILPAGRIQRRWLPLTLLLGIAGEIALSHVHRQIA